MSEPIRKQEDVEHALQAELDKISNLLGLQQMKVTWTPDVVNPLSGKVNGNTIFIFDLDLHDAIITLRHEIVDYLVSKTIEPYKQTLNALIKMLNDKAYREKEEVVDRISKLLDNDPRLGETS